MVMSLYNTIYGGCASAQHGADTVARLLRHLRQMAGEAGARIAATAARAAATPAGAQFPKAELVVGPAPRGGRSRSFGAGEGGRRGRAPGCARRCRGWCRCYRASCARCDRGGRGIRFSSFRQAPAFSRRAGARVLGTPDAGLARYPALSSPSLEESEGDGAPGGAGQSVCTRPLRTAWRLSARRPAVLRRRAALSDVPPQSASGSRAPPPFGWALPFEPRAGLAARRQRAPRGGS